MRLRLRLAALLIVATLPAAAAEPAEPAPASPWSGLSYRLIGPAIGGRITRVAGVAGDPRTYYAAAAQGGVWKSTDGGYRWKPIFDEQPTQSIGSLAVAPSDPHVIYVGGGEANIRGNVAIGLGIWKSEDAGGTWRQVLALKGQIGTLVVDPRDPEVAFAAVLGSPFGPGEDRGVYRTRDGGARWERVLHVDRDTGASDVALDPNNPRIVFAGTWQARRTPWSLTSGGPGGGLYRSADGGSTWTRLAGKGLPEGVWGKVGVAVAPSDSRRVYALIEAENGGLFRSDDAGASWTRINAHRALRQRAWYYTTLVVDPRDADVVWFPQVPLLKSIDGGKSIAVVEGPHHGDHHDLWIDPADPRRMIDGNDGGLDLTLDGGTTWWSPDLPLAQFYNIDVDDRVPWHVGGTIQDMGTASGPSIGLTGSGATLGDWLYVGGGEAGDFVYDRSEPGAIYAGEYGGYITHYRERSGQYRNVSIYPYNPSGHGAEVLQYRFQWTAPIADSPHDPRVIYHGANVLFRSTDQGANWQAISGDLTRNDRSKQQWSGGPITGDNTGVEVYGTIFSIAESPVRAGVIWVGTDDGLVHVSRDGGASWTDVTARGWPHWGTVEAIEPSHHDAGTAYAVIDAHRLDDHRPQVWRTRDFGARWERLVDGLPADESTLVLREDPTDPDLLYLGAERGVHHSRDAGASWQPLQLNLPRVAVTDIEIRHDALVLATRGRGIWVLDDLGPVRGASDAVRREALHLFAPRTAVRWRADGRWDSAGAMADPSLGATVAYWLAEEPAKDAELRLEVLDAEGAVLRTLTSTARARRFPADDPDEPEAEPKPALTRARGFNVVAWDLRAEGAQWLDAKIDAGNPERGPMVPPGRYTLRLSDGSRTVNASLEVRADPRVDPAHLDYAASFAYIRELQNLLDRTRAAIHVVRAVQEQTADLAERLPKRPDADPVREAARTAHDTAAALEARLHNPKAEIVYDILAQPGGAQLYSQLAPLHAWVDNDAAPTQGMRERAQALRGDLERLEGEIAALRSGPLAALEQRLDTAGLPRILLP